MIGMDDERAIIAVLLRYGTGIDTRNWVLFRSCFGPVFEGDYPGFGLWRSGDEITNFMAAAHEALGQTLHRMTNFVIEGDSQRATATSYVDALLMPLASDGTVHRGAGLYQDSFLCGPEGWRIARRRFVPVQII